MSAFLYVSRITFVLIHLTAEKNQYATEVEEALRIARKLRDDILSNKGSTKTNIYGFLSIAQILGREQELSWINSELKGYDGVTHEKIPYYRKNIPGTITLGTEPFSRTQDHTIPFLTEGILSLVNYSDHSKINYYVTISEELKPEIHKILKIKTGTTDRIQVMITKTNIAQLIDLMIAELVVKLNSMISEITYGKILQNIFKRFESKVKNELVKSNPNAVSELNMAYENLGNSEDPERISHVAFSCRRLIKSVADELYPAKNGHKIVLKTGKEVDVGEDRWLNRLEAYADSLNSPNSKYLLNEISMLRDIVDKIPENVNKGVHLNISNSDAEKLVLYSYIILGDLILEKSRASAILRK